MLSRSTILHLRIPFSVFLMPVFCFAAAVAAPAVTPMNYLILWTVLHLFLYPASNGYNSYYDRDEGSIGGLEKPPQVTQDLLYVSLLFDAFALLTGFYFGWKFVLMIFMYGLVSKAYSHPAIRLKKYPVTGLLMVSLFQGAFTFFLCVLALEQLSFQELLTTKYTFPALLSTLLLLGSYPMTQIYQHEEDKKRGDMTLSRLLGVRGTFIFTGSTFLLVNLGFWVFFQHTNELSLFGVLQLFLFPVLVYFGYWFWQSSHAEEKVNYRKTMLLNKLSSLSMITFFTLLLLLNVTD